MNRLTATFDHMQRECRAALIPFVMAGDPSLRATEALVPALLDAGADIIELGIPFSDPLADGPTIQAACGRALKAGTEPMKVIDLVAKLRHRGIEAPIALLTYANPMLARGLDRFARNAASAGVDGVMVADLPPEEGAQWIQTARSHALDTILFLSPTSPPARLRAVDRLARGFIYYVSVTGTTGARAALPKDLLKQLRSVRRTVKNPLCVGFGVSTPQQAATLGRAVDGVIVGSALIKRLTAARSQHERLRQGQRYIRSLARALKRKGRV